uniref:Uncharacterized protein n=1 Tax=Anopheles melas TaxID=34690 RepID=A0A182U8F0_9DIPT
MHHRAGTGGADRTGGCRRAAAAPSLHLAPSPPPPAAPMITTTTTPLPVPALLPATSPLASCGIELEQDTCHSARRRRGAMARPRHHCSATSTSSNLTTSNTTTTTKTAATDGSKSLRSVPWGPRGSLRFGLSTRSRLLPLLVLGLGLVNLLLPASPASAESLSDMALYYDQNSTSLLSGTSLLQLSNGK